MHTHLRKMYWLSAMVVLTAFTFSQNVIKVNSPNSKTPVYTLRKGETLINEEAEITFSGNGTNYEFVTELNQKYYLHSNKFHLGPYNMIPRKLKSGLYLLSNIKWEEDKIVFDEEYLFDINTGKKLGPYKNVELCFDYSDNLLANNSDEMYVVPYVYYEKNGKSYYRDLKNNTTQGPYDSLVDYSVKNGIKTLVYKNQGLYYVSIGDKVSGPFVSYNYNYSQRTKSWILTDKSGKKSLLYKDKISGPYSSKLESFDDDLSFRNFYGSNSNLFIEEKNGIYAGYYLLLNGQKVPGTNSEGDLCYVFETPSNGWVKLEATDVIRKNQQLTKRINPSEHPWYLYYSNGSSFGPFKIENLMEAVKYMNNQILFVVKDFPSKQYAANNSISSNNIFVIADGKKMLQLPIRNSKSKCEFFNSTNDWALFFDGKVYLNGNELRLQNVASFQFVYGSNSWFALEQPIDIDSSYLVLDGKRIRSFGDERIRLEFLTFITDKIYYYGYQLNGWSYERLSSQKEDMGPFDSFSYGGRSNSFVWLKNRHLAFVQDYTNIVINGKDKGKGTALTGNEVTGYYHWMSVDSKNIYLHGFQP
jgi:hypothetical protein